MRLEGSRIYLRPLDRNDATVEYANWLNDPEVNRYLEARHTTHTVVSCIDFIESTNRDAQSHLFGVFLKETSEHIGNSKLGFINSRYLTGQLGFFIGRRDYWGRGYAQEIIKTMTCYGLHSLGLQRIEAGCHEENLASMRAFIRSGYTVEGFFRKCAVFEGRRTSSFWLSILKDEIKY